MLLLLSADARKFACFASSIADLKFSKWADCIAKSLKSWLLVRPLRKSMLLERFSYGFWFLALLATSESLAFVDCSSIKLKNDGSKKEKFCPTVKNCAIFCLFCAKIALTSAVKSFNREFGLTFSFSLWVVVKSFQKY